VIHVARDAVAARPAGQAWVLVEVRDRVEVEVTYPSLQEVVLAAVSRIAEMGAARLASR
jgi:hypothetical protein